MTQEKNETQKQTSEATPEELAEIRNKTGESEGDFNSIPFLRMHGREGGYFFVDREQRTERNTATNVPIGENIEVVILAWRHKLDTPDRKVSIQLYTYEFSNKLDTIEVFESKKGGNVYDQGDFYYLKDKYPGLKMKEVIYVFWQDKVYRIVVKGSSSAAFYKYQKLFKKDTILRYNTTLGYQEERGDEGTYFSMTFTKGDVAPNWRDLWGELRKIPSRALAQVSASQQEQIQAPGEETPEERSEREQEEMNKEIHKKKDDGKEEEVQLSDVPF